MAKAGLSSLRGVAVTDDAFHPDQSKSYRSRISSILGSSRPCEGPPFLLPEGVVIQPLEPGHAVVPVHAVVATAAAAMIFVHAGFLQVAIGAT
jgi:hypothetical protein